MSERLELLPGFVPHVEVSDAVRACRLGARLARVAMNVPLGSRVVDVGTDHARLPIALVQSGRASTAIGVEINDGPCRRATAAVRGAAMSHRIVVRRGDGFAPIESDEADVAVVAGVGGRTINTVLASAFERGLRLERLVLQPNRDVPDVRKGLAALQYRIDHEELVFDEGRVFHIVVVVPGVEELSDEDIVLGPRLRAEGGALYEAWVRMRCRRLERHARPEDRGMLAIFSEARRAF